MKKDSGPYKKIKIYCYIIGLIVFLTAFLVSVFLLHNLEKNEKTTGKYMAQVTEIGRASCRERVSSPV